MWTYSVETEYAILFCENTTFLSMEQKQERGIDVDRGIDVEIVEGPWNVCYAPSCSEYVQGTLSLPTPSGTLRMLPG